ncbi:hypothetical protein D3C80_1851430 [compost metagenome]
MPITRPATALPKPRVFSTWPGSTASGSPLLMKETKLKQTIEMIDRLVGSDWLRAFMACRLVRTRSWRRGWRGG